MSEDIKYLHDLEKSLSLTKGFYYMLKDEDDWSFVVKLHALLESAVSRLLTETARLSFSQMESTTNAELLADIFARIELSNKRTGKVALAKAFGLLLDYQRSFIHSLSELRNSFLHDVKNVNANISSYFNNLSIGKQKQFIKNLGFSISTEFIKRLGLQTLPSPEEFVRADLKLSIWLSGILVLIEISACIETFGLKNQTLELRKKLAAAQSSFLKVAESMKPY